MMSLLREFRIVGSNLRAAAEFGRIRAELRKKGQPIPAIDGQIAAIARVYDLTVLSADRHFQAVSDLTVANWMLG